MDPTQERQLNQAAYRQLKDFLAQSYPKGRYVAISEGQVAGDAETLDALRVSLQTAGKEPRQVLVVQAGVDHPEHAVIF